MTYSQVTSIVVNWNRAQDTLECLASLAAQKPQPPDMIVVDNGSSDDSATQIRRNFPQVSLIVNPSNRGFGQAANQGLRQALDQGADYCLLANNDATLATDGLARLLAQANPQVGILAPLIYYAGSPETIWSMGGKTHPWTLEKTNDARSQPDPGGWPAVIEQDFVTGCGMLLPRSTLEKVGLFDERFAMYYEDSDLCRRVHLAGLKILVVPSAHMWHKVASSSGGSDSPNERYWMARSSVLFFRKHARAWQKGVIVTYRLGSAAKTSLRLVGRGRFDALSAYWRGLRDGLAKVDA